MHSACGSMRAWQIDAVRPYVDVMARRQIALLPSPIFVLPFALEARDHRRGKVGRVLAEQGGEGLLEIAGGNPAQIENGQKGVEALGAPRPFGQDVRREANALARSGGAIAGLRLLHFDRTDSCLDRANWIMPVANHPSAAIRKHEFRGRGQKRLELRLDRLGDQPTRAGSQNFGERIVDCPFLSKGNNSILGHGVTLLLGGSGGLITNPVTPPSSHPHPISRVALWDLPGIHRRMVELTKWLSPAAAAWCRQNDRFERVYPGERI